MTTEPPKVDCDSSNKDVVREKLYWQTFYSEVSTIPAVPSSFCVLVATEVDRFTPIVEFGCGNGRDSGYFNSQGFKVLASDLCKEAIGKNQEKAGLEGATFLVCDCTNEIDVESLLTQAHETGDSKTTNIVVYTRFFLHSIDKTQEQQFVIALGKSMIQGDKLYFEFRCELDEALSKVYGKDHYRRYVKTSEFVDFLKTVGFEIEYEMTGQGMAKYKSEDPFVSRVIAVKRNGI